MTIKPYIYYPSNNITKNTLVLIAGSGEGISRWKPYLNLLLDSYNVVLIDNPGIDSAEYEEDFSAEQLAERYQGFIDELGIEEYFLVGHSFGSFIAQYMALNKPNAVKSLVLVGSSCGSFNQERIIKYQLELGKLLKIAGNDLDKNLDAYATLFGPKYPKNLLVEFYNQRTSIDKKASFTYVLNSAKHSSFAVVGKIKCPTLLVHGKLDAIVDYKNAEILHSLIKNSQLLALENVGHYPYMEDNSVWPTIINFLEGKHVGVISESKIDLAMPELIQKDNAFKAAVSKSDKYKQMLIEIFINQGNLPLEDLHKKYIEFIS